MCGGIFGSVIGYLVCIYYCSQGMIIYSDYCLLLRRDSLYWQDRLHGGDSKPNEGGAELLSVCMYIRIIEC